MGVHSSFTYDHAGERITGLVEFLPLTGNPMAAGSGQDEVTYWVNPWFEVRPGNAPVKYVHAGNRRIARVQGMLAPGAPRVQRLWLADGWNPVTVAVESNLTVGAAFGPDATVLERVRYVRDGNVVTSAGVSAGIDMALWVSGQLWGVETARAIQRFMEYDPAPPYAADV